MKISHKFGMFLLTAAMSLPAGPARADQKGEEVMKLMDAAFTRAKDQHFVYDLITEEPGKDMRKLEIEVWIKGTRFRRVHFLAPGDVKGMRVLVIDQSKMYIYLPAYRKVRRVASHAQDQGFMGTTFRNDDISIVIYSPSYQGKLLSETKTHWKIEARRREVAEVPYFKLEMDILKDMHQPSEIRYFNDKGVKIKTELRTGYSCQGEICNAREMKLVDHVRNETWSKFVRKDWQINTGLDDDFFSLRKLQRGK